MGVEADSKIMLDNTDRNRTSPFAFHPVTVSNSVP